MDAMTQTVLLPRKFQFLTLLECIAIDSFFLRALAFDQLFAVSRMRNVDPLKDRPVRGQQRSNRPKELKDDAPFANGTSIKFVKLRSEMHLGGISVTIRIVAPQLLSVAHHGEAACIRNRKPTKF